MRISIDENACIGCALCPSVDPEVFQMEGDKAEVVAQPANNEEDVRATDAANLCPTSAILVQ